MGMRGKGPEPLAGEGGHVRKGLSAQKGVARLAVLQGPLLPFSL